MAQRRIAEYCVYTIVDGKKLAGWSKSREVAKFDERKPWVTASTLLEKARLSDLAMAVLFGDAADCSRLLYWGFLRDVHVQDGVTSVSVDRVRKLPGRHSPQELVLRSSGKTIARDFIRPYAICRTPGFLNAKDAV